MDNLIRDHFSHTHQCNITLTIIYAPELGREWLSRPACGPWPRTASRTSWECRAVSCCAPPHWSWRGPGCDSPSVSCLVTEFLTPSRISVSSCSEFHFCMLNFAPLGAHFGWMISANVSRWWIPSLTANDWKEEIINSWICMKYSLNSLEYIWLLLFLYSKFEV